MVSAQDEGIWRAWGRSGNPPFCHAEVIVTTFVAVLFVLLGGSPKHGAEQGGDLGRHQVACNLQSDSSARSLVAVGEGWSQGASEPSLVLGSQCSWAQRSRKR